VLGGSTVLALLLGPLINNVPRTPWYLVAAASVLFAIGVAVRPQALSSSRWPDLLPDLFVLPGYLLALLALGLLLRRRDGVRDVHATTDTLIVLTGAASLAISLLGAPAAQLDGRPACAVGGQRDLPLLDVVLLCILIQIGFTSRGVLVVAGLHVGRHHDAARSRLHLRLPRHARSPDRAALGRRAVRHHVPAGRSHGPASVCARALDRPAPAGAAMVARADLARRSIARRAGGAARQLGDDTPGVLRWLLVALSLLGIGLLVGRAMTAVHALGRVQRDTLHEATHDQLTGLPNRVFLDRWLVAELARRRSLTLLYLDLDGFKLVNDSFGHASGDELLGPSLNGCGR
jgi:GGDEF domain-containing protein